MADFQVFREILTDGNIDFGVLLCKVEDGLLAELLLCDVKNKPIPFYSLLLCYRDPVVRTGRVFGEGDHRPRSDKFLDASLLGFPENVKGAFNSALERSFAVGATREWRRGVYDGAHTLESRREIGRRDVGDLDSFELGMIFKGLLQEWNFTASSSAEGVKLVRGC
jgi:hypothetical protein